MAGLAQCSVEGCKNKVTKPGYPLCPEHWKESRRVAEKPAVYQTENDSEASRNAHDGMLTAKVLGEHFKIESKQINRVLAELNWIERDGEQGWKPTTLGEKLRAKKFVYFKNNIPYVVWHPDICKSRILQKAVEEFLSVELPSKASENNTSINVDAADKAESFRNKFSPTIRAMDGHMVRSRGEAMIDDRLYGLRIVHAYERMVPIDEDMYCDFYLPEYDLYVEFWGMESNPKYRARKEKKLELYRQNGLQLIEVKDEHVDNLEDYLIGQLVKFGYRAK